LYCDDCKTPAQKARERKARQHYRNSPEGRAQHCDEQARWRERQQQRERVGDRRSGANEGRLEIPSTVTLCARLPKETVDDPANAPRAVQQLEWLLVAWPELLVAAAQFLGSVLVCPGCERRGVVVRVVSLSDWNEEDER